MKLHSIDMDRDFAIVSFLGIQPHADIRSRFISRKEFQSITTFDTCSMLTLDTTAEVPTEVSEPVQFLGIDSSTRAVNMNGKQIFTSNGKMVYTWKNSGPSKCGSILTHTRNGDEIVYLGIHVAGKNQTGVSTPIFIEDLHIDDSPYDAHADFSILHADPIVPVYALNDDLVFETPVYTSPCNRTTYFPTPFADPDDPLLGAVDVAPCNLTVPNFITGLKKEESMEECRNPDPEAIRILDEYGPDITACLVPIKSHKTYVAGCTTLTVDQGLYGAPDLGVPGFDFSTADGGRLKLLGIKKRWLQFYFWCYACLCAVDGPVCPHCRRESAPNPHLARFKEIITSYLALFMTGNFTLQVCFDALKHELRDIARVKAGAVRIFNVTDFIDNVLIRMAIGHLFAKLHKISAITSQACGINPASNMWSFFTTTLKICSPSSL